MSEPYNDPGGWSYKNHIDWRTCHSMLGHAARLEKLAERLYGEDWTVEAEPIAAMAVELARLADQLAYKLSPRPRKRGPSAKNPSTAKHPQQPEGEGEQAAGDQPDEQP